MKILMLGDVTSPAAARHLAGVLPSARRRLGADVVTVNAENAGFIIGPPPELAELLLRSGADVLTGGNHTLQNYAMLAAIDNMPAALRPANYPQATPGRGAYIHTAACGARVLVISLLGRNQIEPPLASPFETADAVLRAHRGRYDVAIVDFHAEATGEKLALGYHLAGRVSVVAGTHTHVPTADLRLLGGGTGYVSDLGMCGPRDSVIGMDPEEIVERYRTAINHKLHPAEGDFEGNGVLFTVNEISGRCEHMERVTIE